ncbi:MAG: TIM44-like domain-containing protein [Burkholderiaceae bacterium]|nr:TIM44-like domain-containing protein [Burkholderiaceae bacterium]
MKLWSAILICALAFSGLNAEAARRLGGGGSFGKQSSNVTQRSTTTAPAGATQGATNSVAKPAATAPAAAPVAPKKPWGAMLGGLAAGLGLAWLAHSLGLGAAMGQFMMFALLALGIMLVVGMVMRARAKKSEGNSSNGSGASPFAFQGAGPGSQSATDAVAPHQYSPLNVGNDASARPWEGSATAFDSSKSMIGSGLQTSALGGASALSGSQTWGIPADFDTAGFLTAAKRNFVTLQDAWDKSDIIALRSMMTDDMAGEIKAQLAERAGHTGAGPNKTDVVMLEAQLLGIEEMTDGYMASVEFSGMIREEPSSGPAPFREVWNMTKARSGGSGWLVAGVQALQ